jgi:hypothetical protein
MLANNECHLVDVSAVRLEEGKGVSLGHESLLNVPEFQSVERQHVLFVPLLLVLVPAETLRGQDKPVVSRATPHDAQIVDAHPTLADALVDHLASGRRLLLGVGLSAGGKSSKTKASA